MFILGGSLIAIVTPLPPDQETIHKPEPSVAMIKCSEMLNVIVHIKNPLWGSGSGILIDYYESDENNLYHYFVLTNAHVVFDRIIKVFNNVDGLRGLAYYEEQDLGCEITVFYDQASKHKTYDGIVLAESTDYDLALVVFMAEEYFEDIVAIASPKMMAHTTIFDKVYAVGCQLGQRPIATDGILSGIINKDKFTGFIHSAQISPGSSGGGLFKEYNGHYFLIGITNGVAGFQFQFLPHYAYAISTETIYKFLQENDFCYLINDCQSSE